MQDAELNPKVIIALQKQLNELMKKAPDGIKPLQQDYDMSEIACDIYGPIGTPYQGGVFRCKLIFNSEFPRSPPKGYFLTKIFHPNVSEKGEICVNTLKKDWNPMEWSLYGIFEVIKCLLIVPFPESALNEEAGKLFMEDYEEYAKLAKMMTQLHALPKEKTIKSPIKGNSNENYTQTSKVMAQDTLPSKGFVNGMSLAENANNFEMALSKENFIGEQPYKMKLEGGSDFKNADDVLMTVTNSINTEGMQPQLTTGGLNWTSTYNQNSNSQTSASLGANGGSAKKENDKKIWKKRI
mmetsp:Transcript_27210/g.31369  ORF Transcript_27210/g.31369 Transcript_27210/m.31369 type:complete len:296 (-) Transcript_27210:153-1040(-)